ncbi:MAG: NADH-quinone oxidoreductase subunit N [Deltaproteobacteria bacterium]|nr:NADH-quinone oxidoreductase subunit N [Deltaproteobacteria bacterium]
MNATLRSALFALLPELVLLLTALFVLLSDSARIPGRRQPKGAPLWVALTGLLIAAAHTALSIAAPAWEGSVSFAGLELNPVSQLFKAMIIGSCAVACLLARTSREIDDRDKAELLGLLVVSALAHCLIVSASNLIVLFACLEMAWLGTYVLASFKREEPRSSEAGMKLYVYGALSSLLFAGGALVAYGVAGSFDIAAIRAPLAALGSAHDAASIGCLLLIFALFFSTVAARLALFPFHFAAVDGGEGAPIPVAAFQSAASLLAAVALAARVFLDLFSVRSAAGWSALEGVPWPYVLALFAAASMTLGNLAAISQNSLKRMLAYAALSQAGFLLIGLSVADGLGVASMIFSLFTYTVMILGAFFTIQCISGFYSGSQTSDDLSVLDGLAWREPFAAVALSCFLLGLIGVPPLSGFLGRFYLLNAALQGGHLWVAAIFVLNWVIGSAYMLRLVARFFKDEVAHRVDAGTKDVMFTRFEKAVLVFLMIPTIGLGIFSDPFMRYLSKSLSQSFELLTRSL